MIRLENYLFFHEKNLRVLIDAYVAEIRKEVEGWERNKILAASEPDLVVYLVEKFTLDPPRLLTDQMSIKSEGETRIDVSGGVEYGAFDRSGPYYVPGSYVTVSIPFEETETCSNSNHRLIPPIRRVGGYRDRRY